jgi:hypothetical protein
MGQVLVAGGTIQCNHKGQVKLSSGDSRLTVSGNGAITFGMETGLAFAPGSPGLVSPCTATFPNGNPAYCTATLPATAGQATLLAVGGKPVLLDNASGETANPTGPGTWSVASVGQSLLSAS